jgi:hypothetical protein
MIYPLVKSEYDVFMKPLVEQLTKEYRVDGYYECFFSQDLPSKRLLYMPDPWLHEELLEALDYMVKKSCSEGFYLSRSNFISYTSIDGAKASLITSYFDISNDQFRYVIDEGGVVKEFTYGMITEDDILEHWHFYSKASDWAIYIDPGHFVLLAGKPDTISNFDQNFSLDYISQVRDFLAFWRFEQFITLSLDMKVAHNWLLRLVIYIFGRKQGIELLKEFDFFKDC